MRIQHIFVLALLLIMPLLAFAQDDASLSFVNSVSLWAAIVIGLIATLMVFQNAHKVGKSALHHMYMWFGVGMLLIVLGFLAVVIPPWASQFVIMRTHDVLFVVGFAAMAYGAGKMLKAGGLS